VIRRCPAALSDNFRLDTFARKTGTDHDFLIAGLGLGLGLIGLMRRRCNKETASA